MSEVDMFA